MAKPTPLFQRGTQTGPLAPAVAAAISAAESEIATLEAGRGAATLAAMTEGGDGNALARLEADATSIKAKIFNLKAAYRVASDRDARQRVELQTRAQLWQLSRFAAALTKRDELVTKFCKGAKIAAESYRGIRE